MIALGHFPRKRMLSRLLSEDHVASDIWCRSSWIFADWESQPRIPLLLVRILETFNPITIAHMMVTASRRPWNVKFEIVAEPEFKGEFLSEDVFSELIFL